MIRRDRGPNGDQPAPLCAPWAIRAGERFPDAEGQTPCDLRFHLWAHEDLNLGPLPCQGSALPLSYAPLLLPAGIEGRV